MKILFVGESWQGSSARSLKEALGRHNKIILDEVNEDLIMPKGKSRLVRVFNRLLNRAHRRELAAEVLSRASLFKPDIIMTYKGYPIDTKFILNLRERGFKAVNVYPDYSPHVYGADHREAVGAYDLVISTKPFHPSNWSTIYKYSNRCVFVPHGYDPQLHLVDSVDLDEKYDVVMAATWRQEYDDLLQGVAKLLPVGISVAIAGPGWLSRRECFPGHWAYVGSPNGRNYISFVRSGRVTIAPVNRHAVADGVVQPSDEDSIRTYELAAAHCFFIHQRTPFVQTVYDENKEVPMFNGPSDLAERIVYFLKEDRLRREMSDAAHRRAVPAYSLDRRAESIYRELQSVL